MKLTLAAVAGALLIVLAGCLWYMALTAMNGSPPLARKWAAELSSLSAPDDIRITSESGIQTLVFPNGEWVIARSQNSHEFMPSGGGTMVIRDSKGRTRVFFGHVCGPQYLSNYRDVESLAALYDRFVEGTFTEQDLNDL